MSLFSLAVCSDLHTHAPQDMGGLGKLNVAVFNHLDVIAPRIKETGARIGKHLNACYFERLAQRFTIIDHQSKMSCRIRPLAAFSREIDKLWNRQRPVLSGVEQAEPGRFIYAARFGDVSVN
jgi:hypothetical protein